jgi:large subunit ribosomal protein L20
MAHAQSGANRARRKKLLKMAKGYRGRSKNCITVAREKVEKGLRYAYRDRRAKKRTFRNLWIQRINAGVREHGMVYSQFMNGLIQAGITLDRKILSDLATREPATFKALVEQSKAALSSKKAA